ncbi:hypothetical protein [Hymenobacter convexus]|uniref:hypothetical protein n=1 Tax=Hymenobacter sp. CA1UV-4 TaxID=3063782 RepID=UPI0027131A5E|nr:hypothetical protein [Hymenobacter sp. CA1UV-4]MDO7852960.1 hypothetical protein [Hymenobacter sp. CA1UV-4]
MPKETPADYELLISFAAPKALRQTAAKFNVSTGAIRVANAIIYRESCGVFTSSGQLQTAKTASKTLLRANIAELIKAGLVVRTRGPWLRLTLTGLGVGHTFARQLREVTQALRRA